MTEPTRRFRVKPIPHRHHAAGKRKIRRRLDKPVTAPSPEPVITATNIHYFYCNRFFVTPWAGPHILTCVEDTHTAGS